MDKKRVLFVNQEIMPYLPETQMSSIGRHLPQKIQERGKEIRTFMPRFGNINEKPRPTAILFFILMVAGL